MSIFITETTQELDCLQELSDRHDEVIRQLDELEKKINHVLDEFLEKIPASLDAARQEPLLK